MTSSRRKFVVVLILLLVGTCLTWAILLVACNRALSNRSSVPDSFPATDIVYRGDTELGFVNADGSSASTVPFQLPYLDIYTSWRSPILAGDNETLIVTNAGYSGVIGNIYVARAGEAVVDCKWYGIPRLAADGYHMLVETFDGQEKYLPEDCGTGKPPEKVYKGVFGALSPDEQYAAKAQRSEGADDTSSIILHDLKTGEERIIGIGDFPVWSRDGQWLAYTGTDGLYIVQNEPNAEPRRLVALESPEPSVGVLVYQYYPAKEYFPPIASWSPDGKWLVYHVHSNNPVDAHAQGWAKYYSIFKVNVNTGETTKLLDGGYSPSWRWPVEEP